MGIPYSTIAKLIQSLQKTGAYRATAFASPSKTVKVTRVGTLDRRERNTYLRVTIGRPNYAERKFIKACQKAGEPFPVRKVQLSYPGAA
jgi:hypothetical protein